MEHNTITLTLPDALHKRIAFLAEQCALTPEQMAGTIFVLSQQHLLGLPQEREDDTRL